MKAFFTNGLRRHKKVACILLITFIFFFGAFLRFYRLGEVPVSLYWDETAFVYNAYAILHTARDEYGKFLPLLFRSFNDYKMPGNVYLSVIPIALFGLNEFAARFTSAFFGSLTVLLSFFLIKELLAVVQSENKKQHVLFSRQSVFTTAIVTMVLLAISPWHIQFSHAGFEANVGLFFVVFGGLFFLRFIRLKNITPLFLSMGSFGVSLYFYRSILLFVPFLLVGFLFIFKKTLLIEKKKTIIGLLFFLLIALPLFPAISSKEGLARSQQVAIQNTSFDAFYQAAIMQQKSGNSLASKILYNRRLVLVKIFVTNYISHFSPEYLFFTGDINGRHGPRNMGILYVWEIPFVLIGLFILLKLPKPIKNSVLLWILLAPIPAAISTPAPHALRTLNMLPMPQLITALGVVGGYQYLTPLLKKIYSPVLIVTVVIFLISYLHNYYGYSAQVTSADWGDGYKQLLQFVFPREGNYDKIIISGHYWNPYIYTLFYKHYDPKSYQLTGSRQGFGNFVFGGTSWEAGQHELEGVDLKTFANSKKVLVALSPEEYAAQKNNISVLTTIYNHNNEKVFIVGNLR